MEIEKWYKYRIVEASKIIWSCIVSSKNDLLIQKLNVEYMKNPKYELPSLNFKIGSDSVCSKRLNWFIYEQGLGA